MVGRAARMRESSAMFPCSSRGTLKSHRMKTRFPLMGTSAMLSLFMVESSVWVLLLFPGHEQEQVAQAAGVAPLVVVPGQDLGHPLLDHLGGEGVHDGGAVVVQEVDGDQRLLGVAQDALHGAL